jgi:putative transposase
MHLEPAIMDDRILRRVLASHGIHVVRRYLGKIIQRMGNQALCPQSSTRQRHPPLKVYSYLLRKLAVGRATQVWALDTNYFQMSRGFVYLGGVVDVASRKVLAQKLAIMLEACHARVNLELAFARFGLPKIVITYQGAAN